MPKDYDGWAWETGHAKRLHPETILFRKPGKIDTLMVTLDGVKRGRWVKVRVVKVEANDELDH